MVTCLVYVRSGHVLGYVDWGLMEGIGFECGMGEAKCWSFPYSVVDVGLCRDCLLLCTRVLRTIPKASKFFRPCLFLLWGSVGFTLGCVEITD